MDGLTFLKILQEYYPVPVVVVSSLTPSGSAKALEALAAGALDVLAKPDGSGNLGQLAHRLAYHVKAAAHSRRNPPRLKPATEPVVPVAPSIRPGTFSARRVILIGSSTGGVEALRFLLPRLPDGLPPIVVVQHIPPNFSRILANHLDELCPFTVHEAVDGEELRPGLCLVAPGDFHLALAGAGRGYRVRLTQSPPVHHCRPSVDVLFRSAAELAGDQRSRRYSRGWASMVRAASSRCAQQGHAPSLKMRKVAWFSECLKQRSSLTRRRRWSLPRMPQAILQALAKSVRNDSRTANPRTLMGCR